jgi:putative flippase GtrA
VTRAASAAAFRSRECGRFFRFSLVGTFGTAVQLLAVAIFSRVTPGHHLAATAAGLELSLVHNFIWHEHYTWRDRDVSCSRGSRLVRFHLANGLISLAGNLLLVALFVPLGVNVIVANLAAISLCAGLNYGISNVWVFRR